MTIPRRDRRSYLIIVPLETSRENTTGYFSSVMFLCPVRPFLSSPSRDRSDPILVSTSIDPRQGEQHSSFSLDSKSVSVYMEYFPAELNDKLEVKLKKRIDYLECYLRLAFQPINHEKDTSVKRRKPTVISWSGILSYGPFVTVDLRYNHVH